VDFDGTAEASPGQIVKKTGDKVQLSKATRGGVIGRKEIRVTFTA